jgi:hypothetical protein
MQGTLQRILNLSIAIRYVAIYYGGKLASATRPDLANASSSESDKYEELLVNPTLLTLARQRGNIDCGGLNYLVIRYGNFLEFVAPLDQGHVSVGLEPSSDPLPLVPGILDAVSALRSAQGAV